MIRVASSYVKIANTSIPAPIIAGGVLARATIRGTAETRIA
jgi:hypothetical protein